MVHALITEGLDFEQRQKFDRLLIEQAGQHSSSSSTGAEMAARRAFALREGQIG